MSLRAMSAIVPALLLAGYPAAAPAQDAAETAVILSGTGTAQGKAARSLGSATAGSLNRAAAAIGATQMPRAAGQPGRYRRGHAPQQAYVIAPGGDDLKGTDAPTYKVGSGAAISVSGRLVQGPGARCVKNCPADPAGAAPAP